jgi:hypothetical protein
VEAEEADEEVVAIDVKVNLTTNEREAGAELANGVDDAAPKRLLKLSLGHLVSEFEKVEISRGPRLAGGQGSCPRGLADPRSTSAGHLSARACAS